MPPAPPPYRGACLTALLPALAGSVGAQASWVGGTGEDARRLLGIPKRRRVCLLLIDGLGERQLAERAGHARFLAGRERRALDAVFPTTTAASLTSLGTGQPPGTTGVAGYLLRAPEDHAMVSMIAWQGADPLAWQREPTVFEQLAAQGVDAISVVPGKFVGSGLTRAALRGAHPRPAESPDQLVEQTAAALAKDGPGLVYAYWSELDRVGHARGWQSADWGDQLGEVDSLAARLAARCPADAAIYLTADHGMLDVAPAERWDIAATPALAEDVVAVGGEPRCPQLYVAPGRVDEVAARWRAELGDAAWVWTRDEAERAGYFGALTQRARAVIGDVIVAMTGRRTVVDSRVHSANYRNLAGQHGSLTDDERLVPFVRLA